MNPKSFTCSMKCYSSSHQSYHLISFQLQNLNEVDYRLLCQHLGHTLPVHNRWYRLRDSAAEMTKIAKLLITNLDDQTQDGENESRSDDNSDNDTTLDVSYDTTEQKDET